MRTILLVEDEAPIAQLVLDILSDLGHRVVTAMHGLEALMHLREVRPDLIISNVSMPVMDGKELCKQLQSDPELRTIPIVLLSATRSKLDLEECKYTALIEKPFEVEVLLETISKTLGEGDSTSTS